MTLPKGIVLEECLSVGCGSKVYARLLMSLYGLKQASLNWFETLDSSLTSIEIQRLKIELAIYVLKHRMDNQTTKVVLACVDDMILIGDNDGSIKRTVRRNENIVP